MTNWEMGPLSRVALCAQGRAGELAHLEGGAEKAVMAENVGALKPNP